MGAALDVVNAHDRDDDAADALSLRPLADRVQMVEQAAESLARCLRLWLCPGGTGAMRALLGILSRSCSPRADVADPLVNCILLSDPAMCTGAMERITAALLRQGGRAAGGVCFAGMQRSMEGIARSLREAQAAQAAVGQEAAAAQDGLTLGWTDEQQQREVDSWLSSL